MQAYPTRNHPPILSGYGARKNLSHSSLASATLPKGRRLVHQEDTGSSELPRDLSDMRFRESWIDLLHSAATGSRKIRTLLTPLGVVIFGVFTALFVVAAIVVDRLLQLPGFLPEGARLPLSIPVMTAGGAVTAWSAYHFLKVKGTPVPFNPPPQVVKTGPYRCARNPMLTGVFMFLFGVGFGFNSLSLVFFFTPLFVLINVWELKHIEEPELVRRLGDEYIEYRNRTPMFLPGFGPRTNSNR